MSPAETVSVTLPALLARELMRVAVLREHAAELLGRPVASELGRGNEVEVRPLLVAGRWHAASPRWAQNCAATQLAALRELQSFKE